MYGLLLLLFSIPVAVLPTAFYVWLVWRIDRYEKEPFHLLLATFVWGAVPAVIAAVIIELAFDVPLSALAPEYDAFLGTSIVGPLVEENLKALALLGVWGLSRYEFDGVLDGIIYGSLVGFGFAMTENLFYLWGNVEAGFLSWLSIALGRTVMFGLNHAMFSALAGVGLSLGVQASSALRRWGFVLLGLGAAVTAHFFHNGLLVLSGSCLLSFLVDWLGVALVLGMIVLAWRREKQWLQTYLAEEVRAGLLTAEQLAVVTSPRQRTMHRLRLLGRGDRARQRAWRHLVDNATELAFKKHQYARKRDEALAHQIEELRRRIQEEVVS
ncbi:MAG: PrsW family intramembrane metalloprotease [Chloroflexi bacterium]|nr:PrsW family intramembrane metalloprotease [Chloroflexota bacterium]